MANENDDLVNSLMSMLGDHPEEKISSILGALSGGKEDSEKEKEDKGAGNALSLLGGLGGGDTGGLDIGTLLKVKSVMEKMNGGDDNRSNLLHALQPFLSEKRKPVYDKALKMVQMSKMASLAKELDLFKELKL